MFIREDINVKIKRKIDTIDFKIMCFYPYLKL